MIFRLAGITSCQVKPLHTCEYPAKANRPHYSVLDKTLIKGNVWCGNTLLGRQLQECVQKLLTD